MFGGSKRRAPPPPPQPLTKETANPNAATAAASAYLRRERSKSLSSAAAAAALKARPTTPTNVSQVQSKRAVRRSASISSVQSQDRSNARPALNRTPSSGSMSERTFRSPSPGRSPAPTPQYVPPVPSLPTNSSQRHTRSQSAGLSTQSFRTASQKLQDDSWYGAARVGDVANVRTADSVLHNSPYASSEARPGSVSPSINFSYPRARHGSPTPSTASTSEIAMVYDANSRRMVPKFVVKELDVLERTKNVRSVSEKPARRRKQEISRAGSHISRGTVGRTRALSLETIDQPAPSTHPVRPEPVAQTSPDVAGAHGEFLQPAYLTGNPEPEITREQSLVGETSDTTEHERLDMRVGDGATVLPYSTSDNAPTLKKKPSIVQEEQELGAKSTTQRQTRDQATLDYVDIDSLPVRSSKKAKDTGSDETNLAMEYQPAIPSEHTKKPGSMRRARVHSESPGRSPARSAHFGSTTDQLLVRHDPPPRSLSPRKSALKRSNSLRCASPSDDGSEVSIYNNIDEQARKKAVRVSFCEESNIVLGESAEQSEPDHRIVPSPQGKHKPWQNIMGKYNKKDTSSHEYEETMSPRPTLPLFGSVRDKKTREPDNERPLVRPSERTWLPTPALSTAASTDSAIGSALSLQSFRKNEANISKTREPLSLADFSVERFDIASSSEESTEDEEDAELADSTQTTQLTHPLDAIPEVTTPKDFNRIEFVETQDIDKVVLNSGKPQSAGEREEYMNGSVYDAVTNRSASNQPTDDRRISNVPSISITNPSPLLRESPQTSPEAEYFDVPGNFTKDDRSGDSTPASPTRSELVSSPMGDIKEEQESDNNSIYSDCYEDLSDVDADGFMSLDAVLEAQPQSKVSKLYEKTIAQSRGETTAGGPDSEVKVPQDTHTTPDDWENAKTYWRSLSAEKRRQLEREATDEAGEEADHEASTKPKKKNKKRRSTDRPTSGASISDAALTLAPERVYQIQPGTSWAAESYESDSGASAHMKYVKKSMRGAHVADEKDAMSTAGGMRKSLRNGTASDTHGRATSARSISLSAATIEPSRSTTRSLSTDDRPLSSGGLAGAGLQPSLKRRDSDSSESSFKRSRSRGGEGFAFRRTMRASLQEPNSHIATNSSGRFSLRSLSPTGSAFRRSTLSLPSQGMVMGGGGRMRQSLRQGPTESKQKKRFSLGRSSGQKAKQGISGSRFASSSDEEETGPSTFRSRFADSSDEDEGPIPASKSRGVFAKTMRNGSSAGASRSALRVGQTSRSDSPDLPDSDDEIYQSKRGVLANGNRPAIRRGGSGRGSLTGLPGVLDTQSIGKRPAHNRRGSFMSTILRRKKDPKGTISREISESAARRDTRLERSTEELSMIRSSSGSRPRLQKRGPSWPLPDGAAEDVQVPERPATSSGPVTAASHRGFLKRRTLSTQNPPVSALPEQTSLTSEVASDATTIKKKKFGMLRKVFGLEG